MNHILLQAQFPLTSDALISTSSILVVLFDVANKGYGRGCDIGHAYQQDSVQNILTALF
ncbi:MAG: hypothetical protein ACEY3J_01885 [Arsenophonus sp.]